MISVNLLPEQNKSAAAKHQIKLIGSSVLYILAAGLLLISVILFFITKVTQANKITDLKDETDKAIIQLQGENDINRLLTVQNQLQTIPQLHSDKAVSSRVFEYLDKIIPADVTLTSASVGFSEGTSSNGGDSGKIIELNGITRDFNTLNVFVDVLKNAEFSAQFNGSGESVSEDSASTEPVVKKAFNGVVTTSTSKQDNVTLSFGVNMAYDPELFHFDVDKIVFSVPTKITTVSEQERPSNLFIDDPFETESDSEDSSSGSDS